MLPRKTESLLGWLFGGSFPKNILQYKVCSTEHSVEFILRVGEESRVQAHLNS